MGKKLLEVKNLCKKYDQHVVLDNISFSVYEKDIYGILGLSGAGKSTLIRCINNLEHFDSGKLYYEEKQVVFNREYHRNVAMIFQQFNLLKQKTVLKNVMLAGEIVKDKMAKEKALSLLKRVGLANRINAYPDELSGGEAQRVAIARALMSNPKILLSDEATSALDPETTKQILTLLKELNEEMGLTIIMISHQMSVIEAICNRVLILDNSRICEEGQLFDVFLSPKTDVGKKLIYAGHLNTKLSEKKHLKLLFNGEIDSPIVANLIHDCNILISIVYADSKTIDNHTYGQMIIRLPENNQDILKLKKYLALKNIKYEEVNFDGLN